MVKCFSGRHYNIDSLEKLYPDYFVFKRIRAYRKMLTDSPTVTVDHDKFWTDLQKELGVDK